MLVAISVPGVDGKKRVFKAERGIVPLAESRRQRADDGRLGSPWQDDGGSRGDADGRAIGRTDAHRALLAKPPACPRKGRKPRQKRGRHKGRKGRGDVDECDATSWQPMDWQSDAVEKEGAVGIDLAASLALLVRRRQRRLFQRSKPTQPRKRQSPRRTKTEAPVWEYNIFSQVMTISEEPPKAADERLEVPMLPAIGGSDPQSASSRSVPQGITDSPPPPGMFAKPSALRLETDCALATGPNPTERFLRRRGRVVFAANTCRPRAATKRPPAPPDPEYAEVSLIALYTTTIHSENSSFSTLVTSFETTHQSCHPVHTNH